MNCIKKVKQARIIIAANLDVSQDDLMSQLNLNQHQLLNVLLELCDQETNQFVNPFYRKEVTINSNGLKKIKHYISETYQKINDDNTVIKNKEVVIVSLQLIEGLTNKDLKEKDDIEYANVIDNLIFDINNIGIFKIIYNKYKKEFKQHFRDLENYQMLLEKFFDKIKTGDSQYYLLNVIKILSLIAIENTTKQNDMISLINTYSSKLKSKKYKNQELKKYIGMLKRTVEKQGTNSQEIISTLNLNYGIAREFDVETLNEVRKLYLGVNSDYVDLTNKEVVTIDTSANGCLEDGISIEQQNNGDYLFGLYVIDPSAYLLDNQNLEMEAAKRTQAIYLRGAVIPMFPFELSFDMFSLKKGVVRKVIAHQYRFSANFDLIDFKTKKALIKVSKNYSFNDLKEMNDKKEEQILQSLCRFKEMLKTEYPQVGMFYGKEAHVNEDLFLDKLINYIKVFGNHTIANKYLESEYPFIFYVNTDVNQDVNKLQENNPQLDLKGIVTKPKTFYSVDNLGHAGLKLDCYAKVTTPVRNYAAFKNQGLFKKIIIDNQNLDDQQLYLLEDELKKIADYMNYKQEVIEAFTQENNYHCRKVKKVKTR